MTTEKARISTVTLGNIEVEGIMLPNGDFGILVQQVAKLLPNSVTQNNATRSTKALLDKNNPLLKTKVDRSDSDVAYHSRELNYIKIIELEKVIVEASIKGDPDAIELNRQLVGLSLTQLWSDAFGVKFEQEERTQYLANRQEHLKAFHKRLTKWWKIDGCQSGNAYRDRVIEFKLAIGLPEYVSVDDYDYSTLAIINTKETQYDCYRDCGLSHEAAIAKL